MRGDQSSAILSQPLRPGLWRFCPACGKWFALRYERSESHELVGQLDYYRCTCCLREIEFAKWLPYGVR